MLAIEAVLYGNSYIGASNFYRSLPKMQKQHTRYKIVITSYTSRPSTLVRVAGHMRHSSALDITEQWLKP
jgi:hypothetical protein